jgi:hypothetical protein
VAADLWNIRLKEVLRGVPVEAALAHAVTTLADDGAVAAYRQLRGAIQGLGPAFFTKFLYFAGDALTDVPRPRPLILDQRIARVLRALRVVVNSVVFRSGARCR